MSSVAHLRQGDEILVRAIVDRTVGDHAHVLVGNVSAVVVGIDVVGRPRETLTWLGRTWTVLARDEGELWLRSGNMRLAIPEDLISSGEARQ